MSNFTPDEDAPYAGRFYGVTRERLQGDHVVSSRYLGLARTLLGNLRHEMALEEVPVAARSITLPDGTTIRVTCACGVNQIFINSEVAITESSGECEFTLESGLVHYVAAGTQTVLEDTVPGTLYRGEDDVVPLSKKEGKPVIISGDDGLTITLEPMPESGGRSLSYDVSLYGTDQPDPDALDRQKWLLWEKIDLTRRFPSSLYSGKLQLFIQALYGTPANQFRLQYEKVGYGIDYLKLDGTVEIHFEDEYTTGIVTLASWDGETQRLDYFLASIRTNRLEDREIHVEIRNITLSACGEQLKGFVFFLARTEYKGRTETKEWKNLLRRFEAYWLSTARVADTIVQSAALVRPIGERFTMHGWAFSWEGAYADAIFHETVNLPSSGSKRVARHCRISFLAATEGDAPLSISAEVIEEAEYQIRPGLDNIWYFDYRKIINKMVCVVTLGSPIPFGDAPILCFYDNDDTLRVVRYSYAVETRPNPPVGYGNNWTLDLYLFASSGESSVGLDIHYWWGNTVTAGFYCAEVFDRRETSAEHEYHVERLLFVTEFGPEPNPPPYDGNNYNATTDNPPPMQTSGTFGGFSAYPIRTGSWFVQNVNTDETGHCLDASVGGSVSETILIAPEFDARSVQHGSFKIYSGVTVRDRLRRDTRGWKRYFYRTPAAFGLIGNAEGGEYGYIYSGNMTFIYETNVSINHYLVDMWLVDRVPDEKKTTEIVTSDYFSGVGAWATFFDPPMLVDNTNPIPIRCVHDLDDDCFYTGNINEAPLMIEFGEYPYSVSSNFVGWA